MNYKAHSIAGVCAGTITATLLFKNDVASGNFLIALVPMVAGAGLGALLPDIDHPGSKLGRLLYPIAWVINKLFGHRGATHSLLAFFAVSVLALLSSQYFDNTIGFIYTQFAVGISVGFLSHLILDMTTKSGVPLLYPFSSKSYRISRLTTGKHDWIVSTISILLTITTIYLTL